MEQFNLKDYYRIKKGIAKNEIPSIKKYISGLIEIEDKIRKPTNIKQKILNHMVQTDDLYRELDLRDFHEKDTVTRACLMIFGGFRFAHKKYDLSSISGAPVSREFMEQLVDVSDKAEKLEKLLVEVYPSIRETIVRCESTQDLRRKLLRTCYELSSTVKLDPKYEPWTAEIGNQERYNMFRPYYSSCSPIHQTVCFDNGKLVTMMPHYIPEVKPVFVESRFWDFKSDVNTAKSTPPVGNIMKIKSILNFSANDGFLDSLDCIDPTYISPISRFISIFLSFIRYWYVHSLTSFFICAKLSFLKDNILSYFGILKDNILFDFGILKDNILSYFSNKFSYLGTLRRNVLFYLSNIFFYSYYLNKFSSLNILKTNILYYLNILKKYILFMYLKYILL